MKPEDQLKVIQSHLQELQYDAESLRDSIISLSQFNESFKNEKTENEYIDTNMKQPVDILSNIIIEKSKHTETFIENALDPKRMDEIANFLKVMQETMDEMENHNG